MYSVTVENNGGMTFQATTANSGFMMGVNGEGVNPVDTVLAGLCGCVGHYVRDFFTEMKIDCPGFAVRGEGRKSKETGRLSEIDLFLDLKGVKVGGEQEGGLRKHIEKCTIHKTLKAACEIRLVLV